jgi:hypothetical protein
MRIEPRLRFAAREAARWELPDPREAEVVVGVGMGLKRRENVAYAVELAEPLGGAVDATRNVVHAGRPSPHPPPHCELVEAGSARVFLMRWMVYVGERGWPSADVVISTAETEVLIGDRLAGNLGVVYSAWVGEA